MTRAKKKAAASTNKPLFPLYQVGSVVVYSFGEENQKRVGVVQQIIFDLHGFYYVISPSLDPDAPAPGNEVLESSVEKVIESHYFQVRREARIEPFSRGRR